MINQKIDNFRDLMELAFSSGKSFVMPINGTSMLPFLDSTMTVELVKINSVDELKVNDMILFRRNNGQYVLHRIRKIDRNTNEIFVVGDHQHKIERGVYYDNLLGKVDKVNKEDGVEKKLHGFKYKMYLLLWHNLFMRRVFIKLFRIK